MSEPTRLPVTPIPRPRGFVLLGGLLGAVQPVLVSVITRWMVPDERWGTTLLHHARALLPYAAVCAVLGALAGWLSRAAWVRFGREALVIVIPAYAFISTAVLFFLFIAPE
jgi:hypothetical protein